MAKRRKETRDSARGQKDVPPGFTLLHTLGGHKGRVYGLAWSPDGSMLLSASKSRPYSVCPTLTSALSLPVSQ